MRLRALLWLGLLACLAAGCATATPQTLPPAPTLQPLQVYFTPALRHWQERAANCAAGGATATGELAVRFRQPTPVNEPLRIEGRVIRARSPIYYVEGRLLREDGTVCATATAKFLKQTQQAFGEGSYDAVYAPGAIRLTDAERL